MRSARFASLLFGSAVLAVLGLAHCSSFSGEEAPPPADASTDSSAPDSAPDTQVEAATDASDGCKRVPFAAKDLGSGALCGVGACRQTLSGNCPKTAVEGGTPSFCSGAFGMEACGNGVDDNCDGVIDEGCPGASSNAGFKCTSCAFGLNVKRNADGTIVGALGSVADRQNRSECVNSDLCPIPGPSWVRHVAGPGITCNAFCTSIGASCQAECTTTQPPCAPAAASVNQGGKTFGTYAADYNCMEMLNVNGSAVVGTTPNTGACDFQFPDHGFGPQSTQPFNVFCCCKF